MQVAHALAHIGPEPQGRIEGAVELVGAAVEMDENGAGRRQHVALGGDLAELAADHQNDIGLVDEAVGDAVVAAEEAGAQRIGAGDGALAGQRVRNRDAEGAREIGEGFGRIAQVHAAAGEDDGALGAGKEAGRLGEGIGRGAAADRRDAAGDAAGGDAGEGEIVGGVGDVLGHIDDDRAGPAGGGDGEGAAQQLGDTLDRLDPDDLLDRGAQDIELPGLLRHVLAGVLAMRIADDGDQRRAGIVGLDETGHEVGGARPQRRIDDADPAGDLGIGIGDEDRRALVIDEVMVEAQTPGGIVEG